MHARSLADPVPPSIWRLTSKKAKPIVVMHDGARDAHVYCVHSVTGDVAGLDLFAAHFGTLRLHGIQVPKQEMTAHLASTVWTIASHHVASLAAVQPEGPVILIGWSAGAVVAREMAQQLRDGGRDVPLLVALDGAPCNTNAGLRKRDPRYALGMLVNLPRWIRDDRSSDWSLRGIRQRLSEKQAAHRGAGRMSNADTFDGDTVDALVARPGWSPAQKAFVHAIYAAMAAYVPRRYDGRTLVFETVTQPLFHLRQIGAAWRAIAPDCEVVRVRGNHSGLIREPAAGLLADIVTTHIEALAAATRLG